MAFTHGKKARLKLEATDVSAYLDNTGIDQTRDVAETSVYTVDSKTYVAGLKDGKFPLSGRWDPTIDALFAEEHDEGDPFAFEYGPQGTTAGLVKITGNVIITSYKVATPIGAAATFTAELQITGDITRATY